MLGAGTFIDGFSPSGLSSDESGISGEPISGDPRTTVQIGTHSKTLRFAV